MAEHVVVPVPVRGCPACGANAARVVARFDAGHLARCRACGLGWREPSSLPAMRSFYDAGYHEGDVVDTERRRSTLFLDFVERVVDGGRHRLLDVGCGTGEFVRVARAAGWDAIGIERSLPAVRKARRAGLPVYRSAAHLPPASFDLVTLWNVVEYFERPVEELRELRRLLIPGGRVFVRTPNAAFQLAAYRASRVLRWPPALAALVRRAYFFNPLVWSAPSLTALLGDAGFATIVVQNSRPSAGDPYRIAPGREWMVGAAKRVVAGLTGAVARASRGRLLVAPSIEAWAVNPR